MRCDVAIVGAGIAGASLAAALAPPARRGRALAIVTGGISLAVALGVPLGALIGTRFGWRMTFVGVAGLAGLACCGLLVGMPRGIVGSAGDAPTVASPMYKQVWDLRSGHCLDAAGKEPLDLRTYAVDVADGWVRVAH